MKRITAIIKPNMLDDVIFALHKIEDFPGATMSEVRGIGRGIRQHFEDNRMVSSFGYPVQVRLDIVCHERQVDDIVTTIEKNAHTGKPDDGKIFISPIDEAVRISTGQRGLDAIQ